MLAGPEGGCPGSAQLLGVLAPRILPGFWKHHPISASMSHGVSIQISPLPTHTAMPGRAHPTPAQSYLPYLSYSPISRGSPGGTQVLGRHARTLAHTTWQESAAACARLSSQHLFCGPLPVNFQVGSMRFGLSRTYSTTEIPVPNSPVSPSLRGSVDRASFRPAKGVGSIPGCGNRSIFLSHIDVSLPPSLPPSPPLNIKIKEQKVSIRPGAGAEGGQGLCSDDFRKTREAHRRRKPASAGREDPPTERQAVRADRNATVRPRGGHRPLAPGPQMQEQLLPAQLGQRSTLCPRPFGTRWTPRHADSENVFFPLLTGRGRRPRGWAPGVAVCPLQ